MTTFDKSASFSNRKADALAGNRTRASRVAGENSTTEPPMLDDEGKRAVARCQDDLTSGSWLISSPYISNLKVEE